MAPTRNSGIGSPVSPEDIDAAVAAAGLASLPSGEAERLAAYLQLLLRWNSRLNLTAVREPQEIIRRHLVECVQCAQALPPIKTLLDFGSGAGLPGIPIAIVRPEIHITLGESQGKKAAFLREVVRALSLNAAVYDGRIEKMPANSTFDAVTLRAVDKMGEACRVAIQRVSPDGWMALFATTTTERALEQLPEISWQRRIPIVGLDDGLLLIGQKQNVSRGTPASM
jgi:16S rRNA (guanine527-N7)-methyltransferase